MVSHTLTFGASRKSQILYLASLYLTEIKGGHCLFQYLSLVNMEVKSTGIYKIMLKSLNMMRQNCCRTHDGRNSCTKKEHGKKVQINSIIL